VAATLRFELDADGIATITFDDPAGKVNTMTEAWQADLAEAVGMLERDRERIRGVLLASAKSTFFAGGLVVISGISAGVGRGRGWCDIAAHMTIERRLGPVALTIG